MKASVSTIKACSTGFKQIFGRKKESSRLFSSGNLLASASSSFPLNDDYLLPSSVECTEEDSELSLGFDGNNSCDFIDGRDYFINKFERKKEDDDEWKRIKGVLKNCGWNLGSQNSYNMNDLDESNIVQILCDLFEESRDAALALSFFRRSESCAGSKHKIRPICTMIHILVAGNMNYRAMDLILYLVRMNKGEDCWCGLLLKVLHETHNERRVLVTVYSMLVACFVQEHMTNVALKLISQMKHLNCFPSIGVCNSLLVALLRSEQLDLAWDFLEEIQSQGFHLNVSILSLFIHMYCTKGNVESGWKLLTEMKKYGIKPDVVAYTMLIDSLCKMSLLREATSMFFKMIQTGISPDSISISSIVDGFCKVGRSEKALKFLDIFNFPPNIYVYNSFISKLCTDGNIVTASNVFEEMLELGLQPDCFTYTTIIGGYCKLGEVNAALNLVGRMLKAGIKPSVTTYTTLVEGYCKCGEMDAAEQLFHKMVKAGLAPDVFAYNVLMDGYGKKGYLHKAFGLLDMMKSTGISPDIVTYNIVIHSLVVRGFCSGAKDKLEELIRRGLSPDVVTLTNVISGHAKKGNFEEAFLVWFYMNEHHMKPDVVTCSALLHGYCKAHRMEEANALFHKMLDIGLVPDLVLFNALIRGFCSVGNVDDACQLINIMVEHGFVPNDSSFQALILGYEKKQVQNPEETAALKLQQILLEYGLSIDVDHHLKYIRQAGS